MTFKTTVLDPTGKPVSGALVTGSTEGNGRTFQRLTDGNGYADLAMIDSVPNEPVTFSVIKDGYKVYGSYLTTSADDQTISVALESSFRKPSRAQIINVKANFCNLRDSDDIPIFDGFIDALLVEDTLDSLNKAEDWASRLAKAGTHITLDLSGDYNENLGWAPRYPIPGHDWTNDLYGFSQVIKWCQSWGLIPIVKLGFDGQAYDPNGWTYGWQWGMDNIERIANGLASFNESVLWSTGWDGCFPNWTRDQTIQMLQKMRAVLGNKACISTEFGGPGSVGYCHMGQGAADWQSDKLGILDNFEIEVNTFPFNPTGVQQTAARLLGPKATNIDPPNQGPYYLAEVAKDINICLFENIAYQEIRKQATSQDAIDQATRMAHYGFSSFGNGQPS